MSKRRIIVYDATPIKVTAWLDGTVTSNIIRARIVRACHHHLIRAKKIPIEYEFRNLMDPDSPCLTPCVYIEDQYWRGGSKGWTDDDLIRLFIKIWEKKKKLMRDVENKFKESLKRPFLLLAEDREPDGYDDPFLFSLIDINYATLAPEGIAVYADAKRYPVTKELLDGFMKLNVNLTDLREYKKTLAPAIVYTTEEFIKTKYGLFTKPRPTKGEKEK